MMFWRRSKRIWIKAILSVMASFLGVQSNENRAHDFEQGRFPIFVVSGLLMTLILLVSVYGLVQLVMMYVQ
ncbi:MAG: DUF2970 domain-containing protein [Oceanospirillales bacterium TMED33]|nr:hypothetical protein [Gammaproteobacteria bacterium]RPG21530.1 MAG: DUF2970 domain-containing protein [Oceanospirillales bacterium TMED33]CAI8298069.1 MAG: Uncharacterised protein [Gammaproteobacteria bacterium]